VAFAAACAQRVATIYRLTAQHAVVHRGFNDAIDTAWAFAQGEEINARRLQDAKDQVNEAFPEPDLGGGPDHFAVAAAAYALDAIEDKTPKSAWLAAGRARDAISQIDDAGGVEEEITLQHDALQIAKDCGDTLIQRDMFDSFVNQKAEWQIRWELS